MCANNIRHKRSRYENSIEEEQVEQEAEEEEKKEKKKKICNWNINSRGSRDDMNRNSNNLEEEDVEDGFEVNSRYNERRIVREDFNGINNYNHYRGGSSSNSNSHSSNGSHNSHNNHSVNRNGGIEGDNNNEDDISDENMELGSVQKINEIKMKYQNTMLLVRLSYLAHKVIQSYHID